MPGRKPGTLKAFIPQPHVRGGDDGHSLARSRPRRPVSLPVPDPHGSLQVPTLRSRRARCATHAAAPRAARPAGRRWQSSITCSGQPKRALASSATASGVARSWRPQIRVVGTASGRVPRSGSRAPRTLHQRGNGGLNARRAGAIEVVGLERRPLLAHGAGAASRLNAQCARGPGGCARSVARGNSTSASPNSGAGWNWRRPNVSTSTSRLSRSPWAMAKRAAMAPPSNAPPTRAATCRSARSARQATPARAPHRAGRPPSPRRRGPAGRGQ